MVHPIERLRYVARASGADHGLLARETAEALASLGFDPPGMVTACRRVIERHPASGPLWTMAARLLCSNDPMGEAWRFCAEMDADRTGDELAHGLPDEAVVCVLGWPEVIGEALVRRGDVEVLVVDALGEGTGLARRLRRADVEAEEVAVAGLGAAVAASDVVLLEASAVSLPGFVAVAGSRAAAAVARHAGVPVWLVAGVGRVLAPPLWQALAARLDHDAPWDADDEVVPGDLVDVVMGPDGPAGLSATVAARSGPVAPELLRFQG